MTGELPNPPSAVALIGDAARDCSRISALLSANAIVVLLPSLQTAVPPLGDEIEETELRSRTTVSGLCVDLIEHRVSWEHRELSVSHRELSILAALAKSPGRACTFAELAEPWGARWLGDTERVHSAIKRIRRKLAEAAVDASIESVRGYGYRLVVSVGDHE